MEENMIVVDEMEYDALPPFIASADVGLCLYYQCDWHKTFYFSPLKLFDYMSSGLPIIATDAGQIGRVIENGSNGILTDNDAADVAEKILHLKRAPNERKKLGERARMDVCNYYNWTRAAMDTESVLMNMVGGRL
jgi:glycosyltransferase involved in cell wall biosynthesis